MSGRWLAVAVVLVAVIGILVWVFWPRQTIAPSPAPALVTPGVPLASLQAVTSPPAVATVKTIRAQDIPEADKAFTFTATVPEAWQVEAVAGAQAISFYDPAAAGASVLDRSQIFIRSFRANDFLTLTTVDIHSRQALTINGRPAVRYDIEKKASVADFPAQPAWRNVRHIVTDIRVSDSNPSVFYVIARRPDLDEQTYKSFLQSLVVDNAAGQAAGSNQTKLVEPVDQFRQRVTKKPFGIYVTTTASPVQPERFSGYHTAADAEYEDATTDVLVRATADGQVLVARQASGYGGLIAIQHTIDGQPVIGIYRHLRPSSLPPVGQTVSAGRQVGVLGTGYSDETDGERRHLHLGLVKGTTVNLLGYVPNQSQLSAWLDPLHVGL